ncbi:hypothetical protein L3X38_018239 [Prunus dulcis]|uniref:Uncharacterized protein n=1 Tax=Prunus dulcis TaxID=3755 RepID=A0AAD4WAM3_PRUDU|nr:hypothetical protein L3X38_018239 [Prunus dulcis]
MDESLSHNDEAHASSSHSGRRRGGWFTFPFITGALVGLTLTAGGWLSNLIVFLTEEFNRVTRWLPDDINNGKLDNVYWMLVVVGVLNFGYYLVCAKLYKYQNVKDADVNSGSADSEK